MNILLDTNILLNDFFHRNPDFGFQRIQDPEQIRQVENYRQTVHEALLFISLQKNTQVLTTTTIFARFASLLGDLLVPGDLVSEELTYWAGNLKWIEVLQRDLEESLHDLQNAENRLDFDDYLLRRLGEKHAIDMLLTSLPKSREFFWPVLVFKPEKIRELNWEALEKEA
jgi:hypothetical protein